jgi:aerobic carbon-monoxide dehydrogenase medium subunit
VKPSSFQYHLPRTPDEAVELLEQYSDSAKVLAGGQSLIPLMNLRMAHTEHLIDLNRLSDLAYVRADEDSMVTIGAMTRQRAVEKSEVAASKLPVLKEALSYVGHTQIRNRGTVVGSICHADPASELPALWLAVGGTATVVGAGGTRQVEAEDFFRSYFTTAVQANELVTEIKFNAANGQTGHSVREVARRHGDFALAGAVARVTLDDAKNVADARLALYGVGGTPLRATDAEALLRGRPATDETWREAAAAVTAQVSPGSDVHASADYRRHVSGILARRSLAEAAARAADAG